MNTPNACFVSALFSASCFAHAEELPEFALVQEDLLSAKLSMTHAWADFDNDGDLDLHVGFRSGIPNRLYRNDNGILVDMAPELGVADMEDTRAVAWGDFNADGLLDLYVGYTSGDPENPIVNRNRIYRNDGNGFTEVAEELGLQLPAGNARQVSWIDFDADGDIDLFVGFRSKPNRLFRNDEGVFRDVSEKMGISGSRATMGGVWFDFDKDGDLDLYLGNADGFGNRMYRNDKTRFVDVAFELGIDGGGRVLENSPGSHDMSGTVRTDVTDYDNDGDFDVYVTNRKGTDAFYRNDNGRFSNIAEEMGMLHPQYRGTAAWADFNNDGWIDVYVHKTLYANTGGTFMKVTPSNIEENIGGYGNTWADFDNDGAVDLSLSTRNHYIFRNLLPEESRARSLKVMVLNEKGVHTRAGCEIRLFDPETGELIGTRMMETGSDYNSQSVMPVHFGLPAASMVNLEITSMTNSGRKTARLTNIDPKRYTGSFLGVKVDNEGQIVQ